MRPKTRHSEQRLPFVVEQCFPKFSESKFKKNLKFWPRQDLLSNVKDENLNNVQKHHQATSAV